MIEIQLAVRFSIVESLRAQRLPVTSHKIIISGLTRQWTNECCDWAFDYFMRRLTLAPQRGPNIVTVGQNNTRAFSRACDHPNALVILEGVDNSDAILDYLARQTGRVLG